MSTHKYLDSTGLGQVWEKIKNITLVKNNTTSYTPTADYHPATKKYVDDATASITDEKLSTNTIGSGVYYPIVGTNTSSATTKYIDSTGFKYDATSSTNGYARLYLGNGTASGTEGSKYGRLMIYGTTAYAVTLDSGSPTENRDISLPNKNGTIALTSDIPTKVSDLTNDSGFITSYVVTITSTTTEGVTTYSADKTFAEITAAVEAGKQVTAINNNYVYYYTWKNNSDIIFHSKTLTLFGSTSQITNRTFRIHNDEVVSLHTNTFQNKLTFDSTPTENSTNPVTSGGVYTALANISQVEPEDDIVVLNLLSEFNFTTPITDADGDLIEDADNYIFLG